LALTVVRHVFAPDVPRCQRVIPENLRKSAPHVDIETVAAAKKGSAIGGA